MDAWPMALIVPLGLAYAIWRAYHPWEGKPKEPIITRYDRTGSLKDCEAFLRGLGMLPTENTRWIKPGWQGSLAQHEDGQRWNASAWMLEP